MDSLVVEVALVHPRLGATTLDVVTLGVEVLDGGIDPAVVEGTDEQPGASHDVTGVDDVQDEASKTGKIVLPLLGVLLEQAVEECVEWAGQSWDVDESEKFEPVILNSLTHEELRKSSSDIEDEVSGQVVVSNGSKLLVGSGLLNEVEEDLNEVDDVNGKLDLDKGLLICLLSLAVLAILITSHVLLRESKYEWTNEQSVNRQEGDHEVPDFAEGTLGVDQVPLELRLTIDDLVLLIGVLVDIVYHHLLEVRLSHFLETGLESQLVVVTSSLAPEHFNTLLLLLLSHGLPLGLSVVAAGVRLALSSAREDPHE